MHSNTTPDACQHIALGDCSIGSVTICPDCNVIHLALTHITVRLAPHAFRALVEMVGSAQSRLDHVAQASAAAAAVIDDARHGPKLH